MELDGCVAVDEGITNEGNACSLSGLRVKSAPGLKLVVAGYGVLTVEEPVCASV